MWSNHIEHFCARKMALYGAASLRIGYGIAGTAYYLRNYSDRHFLWGPDGVYPLDSLQHYILRPGFSIYEWAASQLVFEVLFHSGIVVGVLFCLGIGGRFATVAHYVFLVSLFLRNPALLDGGDNLAYMVLLYLIPVDTTAVLSVGRLRKDAKTPRISTVLHNTGVVLIAMQVFVVYLASAMFKIQGRLWQDGTAMYYILRVPEFSWPLVTDHVIRYAWLIVISTYFAVLFQLLFPVLIAIRETRVVAIVLAILFHGAIGIFMGLTSFSIYMIATEAIFLSDRHYRRLGVRVDRLLDRVWGRSTRAMERICERRLAETKTK